MAYTRAIGDGASDNNRTSIAGAGKTIASSTIHE
jgi:hypothetical protein